MLTLALDTAFEGVGVALNRDGAACVQLFNPKPHQGASQLLPMIQEVLNKANATQKDLQRIVVVRGPGSFTGIRLGLATAQSLSLGLQLPWQSVTSFELFAYSWLKTIPSAALPEQIWIVVDTKGFEMGMVVFSPREKRFLDPFYGSPESLARICCEKPGDIMIGMGLKRLVPYLNDAVSLTHIQPDVLAGHLAAYPMDPPFKGELTQSLQPLYGETIFKPLAPKPL